MNKPEPTLFKEFLQPKFKEISDELQNIVIDETDSKSIITKASDSLKALKSVLQKWASLIGFNTSWTETRHQVITRIRW